MTSKKDESTQPKQRPTIKVVRVRTGIRSGGGGECNSGACGTPTTSGGGGCGCGGGSILLNN